METKMRVSDALQYERLVVMLDTLIAVDRVIAYKEAARILGYSGPRDPNLHWMLGLVFDDDVKVGRVPRAAVVINNKFVLPGDTYFTKATAAGLYTGGATMIEQRPFWESQLAALGMTPVTWGAWHYPHLGAAQP